MPAVDLNEILTTEDRGLLATHLFNTGNFVKSEQLYVSILGSEPDNQDAMVNVARCMAKRGMNDLAERTIDAAIKLNQDNPHALGTKGLIVQNSGYYSLAENYYMASLTINPNDPQTLINYAYLSQILGRFDKAFEAYTRARDLNPMDMLCRFWRSMAMITLAHDKPELWPEALSEYEVRQVLYATDLPNTGKPLYCGQGLQRGDSILLCGEQGIGDFVMMARYARHLKGIYGVSVYGYVKPHMKKMAERIAGFDGIFGIGEELPDYTYHIPVLSLLRSMKFPLAVADSSPYMNAPKSVVSGWTKVGVCWQGNKDHGNDAFRSLSFGDILPHVQALNDANVKIFSLQQPEHNKDCPEWITRVPIEDLESLSSVIASMDVVISVDSAPAHIAGAMGIPTRMLVPSNPDWRWGASGSSSIWYPTMEIIRAAKPKQWAEALKQAFSNIQ